MLDLEMVRVLPLEPIMSSCAAMGCVQRRLPTAGKPGSEKTIRPQCGGTALKLAFSRIEFTKTARVAGIRVPIFLTGTVFDALVNAPRMCPTSTKPAGSGLLSACCALPFSTRSLDRSVRCPGAWRPPIGSLAGDTTRSMDNFEPNSGMSP